MRRLEKVHAEALRGSQNLCTMMNLPIRWAQLLISGRFWRYLNCAL